MHRTNIWINSINPPSSKGIWRGFIEKLQIKSILPTVQEHCPFQISYSNRSIRLSLLDYYNEASFPYYWIGIMLMPEKFLTEEGVCICPQIALLPLSDIDILILIQNLTTDPVIWSWRWWWSSNSFSSIKSNSSSS